MKIVQKTSENFWQVVETFTGRQGRKVALGFVSFWVATALLREGKITAQIWWWVFLADALLVGFGTVLDKVVESIGDKVAGFVADKVNAVFSKTTVVEEHTEISQTGATDAAPPSGN